MILESSNIKNWDEFYEKLKNNLNPVIPDELKGSIVRDNNRVFGFIDLKFRKKHLKDTKGNRLAKKKKNKIETFISPWTEMMINSLPKTTRSKAASMYGRTSFLPGGIEFRNEVNDLWSPKPVESSEEYTIPRSPVLIFNPKPKFSENLIDFLNAPGKEIIVVGKNYYDKETGLKEGIAWLDEASDMADAFAYSLENKLNYTKYELPQHIIDDYKKRTEPKVLTEKTIFPKPLL